MKLFIYVAFVVGAMGIGTAVSAHVPFVVTQESLRDIHTIEEPDVSQAFYGAMAGFPHTYEIRSVRPFDLRVQIMVPDIPEATNNISGIIIREVEGSGRVEEVTRLRAGEASWESLYEPFGGDSYRVGPLFKENVRSGTYRIEVNTPDNIEKYILVVGYREDLSGIGFFELIRRIAEVKVFFGKSQLRIIESPFIYVPLILLLCFGYIGRRVYVRIKRR